MRRACHLWRPKTGCVGVDLGVYLAELGDWSVLVDHATEDSMASDRGAGRDHGGGLVGVGPCSGAGGGHGNGARTG